MDELQPIFCALTLPQNEAEIDWMIQFIDHRLDAAVTEYVVKLHNNGVSVLIHIVWREILQKLTTMYYDDGTSIPSLSHLESMERHIEKLECVVGSLPEEQQKSLAQVIAEKERIQERKRELLDKERFFEDPPELLIEDDPMECDPIDTMSSISEASLSDPFMISLDEINARLCSGNVDGLSFVQLVSPNNAREVNFMFYFAEQMIPKAVHEADHEFSFREQLEILWTARKLLTMVIRADSNHSEQERTHHGMVLEDNLLKQMEIMIRENVMDCRRRKIMNQLQEVQGRNRKRERIHEQVADAIFGGKR